MDCSSAPETRRIVNGKEMELYSQPYSVFFFSHVFMSLLVKSTFPKDTEGEKGPPALFVGDGLLSVGLYPGTQLGENLGLLEAVREGLKLSTLWPCRGDDWAGAGASFFSGFWGGDA